MTVDLPALFEEVFAASPWPMLMLDAAGAVIGASDESEAARPRPQATAPDTPLRERAPHYLSLLTDEPAPKEADSVRRLPSGAPIHERIHLRRTGWGACLTIVDQSELHRLRTVEAQTARLAALGFMVAGVSHEVTNPLTSLHSIVQILRAEKEPSPQLLAKGLDNISVNVKRILDISRRLVTFSRVGDDPHTRFAIDAVVDEALHVLRQDKLLQGIELRRRDDPSAMVSGDIGQVREIFMNVLVNAAHAMAGRGTLTLETTADAKRVRVLVGDSGPGVPKDLADRIFEPFFTTKGATDDGAQGTGLGLAISNEIAQEHGGSIELVRSSPEGAVFGVTLPRSP